ncbi:MAG: hypothetical protein NDJ90_07125 [Oligoflexia bacterium]|nr:hypothetical protein [Oligoflexia bacterium]
MKKKLVVALLSLSTASSAFAGGIDYRCFSYYWNGDRHEKGTMDLSVAADSATANIVEELWDDGTLGGKIDSSYRPRGSVKYVKFGSNLIVEAALLSGGKKLRDGSLGGFVRVEGQAEGGFYQYKFVCRR